MNIRDRLFVFSQYLIPQHLLSRFAGAVAETEIGFVKNTLISVFKKKFGVDLSEAERENLSDYVNFNDFFTRALKPEARIIQGDDSDWVSPVDGQISEMGLIKNGKLIQAKNRQYTLLELLGGDTSAANRYKNGHFATIYLSPKDYHRIHMPIEAKLTKTTFIPGKLFSVNPTTASAVPNLFARNERLVCEFESSQGRFIMVLVGAMIVASIETTWAGVVAPFQRKILRQSFSGKNIQFAKAEEIARFRLGSTVILVTENDALTWHEDFKAGSALSLGQKLNTEPNLTK